MLAPATRRATSVPTRTAQLRRIHVAAHQLGLETDPSKDRTAYESALFALTGQRSARRMCRTDREQVLSFFEGELAARKPVPVEVVTDEEALAILGLL